MFQIALCEDERIFAQTQEQICRRILDKLNTEYRVDVFGNGYDLFTALSSEGKGYDLILLDVVMEGMNGMELARKIREVDRETEIIFVTSSRDYAIDGYDVGALHYLVKPVDENLLERLITKIHMNKYQSKYLVIKSGSQNLRLAVKEIVSLEIVGRKVEIEVLSSRTFHYSGKLTELLDAIPGNCIVRCHQAFAVNIQNLRELTRFDAIAVNGKRIPISRPYLKDVQTAFLMSMQGH